MGDDDKRALGAVWEWTHQYGAALKPPGADTYGEGMRDAKAQVRRLLSGASSGMADLLEGQGGPVTPPITEEQLAELERLEREALPGPWRTGRHPDPSCDVAYVHPHGMPGEEAATIYLEDSERHAAFIVAARNALPALIAEVRRLRAVVDACARAGCPTAATASAPASSPPPRSKD